MSCGIPIIIICGSRRFTKKVRNGSENLAQVADNKFYCNHCKSFEKGIVLKSNNWFTLCCIPLYPIHFGNPFVGCSSCWQQLDAQDIADVCQSCHNYINNSSSFCPYCGNHHIRTL
jgi:hypothetical protein